MTRITHTPKRRFYEDRPDPVALETARKRTCIKMHGRKKKVLDVSFSDILNTEKIYNLGSVPCPNVDSVDPVPGDNVDPEAYVVPEPNLEPFMSVADARNPDPKIRLVQETKKREKRRDFFRSQRFTQTIKAVSLPNGLSYIKERWRNKDFDAKRIFKLCDAPAVKYEIERRASIPLAD